jgi:hypothetical protein
VRAVDQRGREGRQSAFLGGTLLRGRLDLLTPPTLHSRINGCLGDFTGDFTRRVANRHHFLMLYKFLAPLAVPFAGAVSTVETEEISLHRTVVLFVRAASRHPVEREIMKLDGHHEV